MSVIALPEGFERRVIQRGLDLLTGFRKVKAQRRSHERWLDNLRDRIMDDSRFRVQALRFVDVLPVLSDDQAVVRHLREYFGDQGLPLTGLVSWGMRHAGRGVADLLIAKGTRKAISHLAKQYVGGADAKEALATLERLRESGKAASLDLLGEAVVSESEAEAYAQRYLEVIDALAPAVHAWPAAAVLDVCQGRLRPRLNLSIKLSSLYSRINPLDPEGSVQGVAERLRALFRKARAAGVFMCLDMEQYDFKHLVLQTFKSVLSEPEFSDWPDAGIALQAYLKESTQDLEDLIQWAGRRGAPVTVRLVRGAYWDYETVIAQQNGWPSPVFENKAETDASYERLLVRLLGAAPVVEAAVATHNVRSIALAMTFAEYLKLEKSSFEFQMLYGMAEPLEDVVRERGYRLRVYVPCGELIPGMAYLVRRLLENSSSQSFQRIGLHKNISDMDLLGAPKPVNGERPGKPEGFVNEPPRRFALEAERDAYSHAIAEVRRQLDQRHGLYIGGQWTQGQGVIASINPAAPDERIGEIDSAGLQHCEAALQAARTAFAGWARLSVEERAGYLRRVAMLLRARRDEFSAWEILEAGKTWREADGDVVEAIDFLEYYAAEAVRLARSQSLDRAGETNAYGYRPRGVGVVISPWNFPLAILAGMLSAAIVAGNTVVLKPSSQTPVIAAQFMRLFVQAELPPGVVNLVFAAGGEVGEFLVRHPLTDFVAFTGSEAVGRKIIGWAAQADDKRNGFRTVVAEMGGKNALILDEDADLDDAIPAVLASAFGYQGQKCSAASRVIVVGDLYKPFLERCVEAARGLVVGAPWEPASQMGPVIEERAYQRIRSSIEAARASSHLVLETDCAALTPGYFLGPTIFAGVPPDSALAQEEIFGPVLAVMPAESFESALQTANNTRFALTGGVYSRSPGNLARAREAFEVGNLYLNRRITGAVVGHQPFGGFRQSGLGDKAGGPDYLLRFMIPRCVTENTLRRGFAPGSEIAHTLGNDGAAG